MARTKRTPEEQREHSRIKAAEWYWANRDRARESRRAWREAHHEELLAKKRAYAATHRAEDLARVRAWVAAHPEQKKRNARAWIARHPDRHRKSNLAWQGTHKAQINARRRELYALNRMGTLIRQAQYRAKQRGLDFDGLPTLVGMMPTVCACCGLPFDYTITDARLRSASLDRVEPLKGYTTANVRVICWRCNAIKSDATLEELEMVVAYVKSNIQSTC